MAAYGFGFYRLAHQFMCVRRTSELILLCDAVKDRYKFVNRIIREFNEFRKPGF